MSDHPLPSASGAAPAPLQTGLTELHQGDLGLFEGSMDDAVVFAHYRTHNTWSPELLELLQGHLGNHAGTFIDVGANIGLVAVPIAERTRATVYAFEPVPSNHSLLKRNVARHGLEHRIQLFQCAAYDSAGEVNMSLSSNNHGDHQVATHAAATSAQVTVRTARIADCLQDVPTPGPVVMKVDTQGCEQKVLTGAADLLNNVDTLVVEYWPLGLSNQGNSLGELNRTLLQFPYAKILSQTQGDNAPAEPSADVLDRLLHLLAPNDPGFFDLVLTRTP